MTIDDLVECLGRLVLTEFERSLAGLHRCTKSYDMFGELAIARAHRLDAPTTFRFQMVCQPAERNVGLIGYEGQVGET